MSSRDSWAIRAGDVSAIFLEPLHTDAYRTSCVLSLLPNGKAVSLPMLERHILRKKRTVVLLGCIVICNAPRSIHACAVGVCVMSSGRPTYSLAILYLLE